MKKLSLILILVLVTMSIYIYIDPYEKYHSNGSFCKIKDFINENYDDDLFLNIDDFDINDLYIVQNNDIKKIILHSNKPLKKSINFIVLERNNNSFKLCLAKSDISNYSFLNSKLLLLETNEIGIGSGIFGSNYMIYDNNYKYVWEAEKNMTFAPFDSKEIFKILGNIDVKDNIINYKQTNLSYVYTAKNKKEQLNSYEEKYYSYEYKNNEFKEIK